jgi:hypothetical protein
MQLLFFSLTDVLSTILKDMKNTFVNDATDWINIFRIVGGLGAMITITTKYFKDQAGGKPFDFSNYTRPFVVMIFLILYKPVIDITDTFFDSMEKKSNNMWVQVANSFGNKAVMGAVSGIISGGGGLPTQSVSYDSKGTPDVLQKMNALITGLSPTISSFNGEVLKGDESQYVRNSESKVKAIDYIKLMADSAGPVMRLLARIILILLFITGPIAIGLSLFPTFNNSLSTWISAYVKISLWAIISNIIQYVIIRIITNPAIIGSIWLNKALGDYGEGSGAAIFYFSIVLSQMCVPTIASSIISSSGFDGMSYSLFQSKMAKMGKVMGG